MLSKVRKYLKFLPKFFTVLGAVSMAFALLLSVVNMPVIGQAETCPASGDWIKVDVGDKPNFQYTAPDGKLVAEWCYKAGNNPLVFENVVPPQKQVSLTSIYQQGISHASFRLVNIPTNTPPPSPTPTFTATFTPTNTPTNTPVSPTATFTATNTPTNTPIPDDPEPTPTNTPTNTPIPDEPDPTPTNTAVPEDPGPTSTPVPDETPDPTEPPVVNETPEPTLAPPVSNDPPTVLIPVTGVELGGDSPLSDLQNFVFNMGLTFLGLGLILQSVRKRLNF